VSQIRALIFSAGLRGCVLRNPAFEFTKGCIARRERQDRPSLILPPRSLYGLSPKCFSGVRPLDILLPRLVNAPKHRCSGLGSVGIVEDGNRGFWVYARAG